MKKQIDHVAEFHDVFQIGNELSPKVDVGSEVYMLRYNLNLYQITSKNLM